jgi:hypothetical protein
MNGSVGKSIWKSYASFESGLIQQQKNPCTISNNLFLRTPGNTFVRVDGCECKTTLPNPQHNQRLHFHAEVFHPNIMKALVTGSTQSKKEQVLLGMNEKALDQKWLDDVNSTAGASLSFSKDKGNFEGGLLLVEGESFINITADTLFALLREDAEKPVADILFRG